MAAAETAIRAKEASERALAGHQFGINQNSLQSDRGRFWLRAPGYFVLEDASGNQKWASSMSNTPADAGCGAEMQADGNLAVYVYHISPGNRFNKLLTWSTNTTGNPGAYLQIDWQNYKVQIMNPDGTKVLWSS